MQPGKEQTSRESVQAGILCVSAAYIMIGGYAVKTMKIEKERSSLVRSRESRVPAGTGITGIP